MAVTDAGMGGPDIQYFGRSGTWVKPAGAVRADVILQGGGGGAAFRGQAALQPGKDGMITVSSIPADELPAEVTVTVGHGGRPGGRDGYALIITHLSGMVAPGGGRSYVERHGHLPDDPCTMFCPGSPSGLGGNGGAVT